MKRKEKEARGGKSQMKRIPGRIRYYIREDWRRGLSIVGLARKYGYTELQIEREIWG